MPDPVPSRRVALVIGNGAYETARKLMAPPGDAARMAQLLQGLGFRVIPAFNSDFNDLRQALRRFYDELRGADIGLLYFSGHGVQDAARENYLLPVDAELHEPEDLTRLTFSLRRIMSDMHDRVETGLIFLDACRDNPFDGANVPGTKSVLASSGGLAKPKGSLGGLLVAFASDEGNVALDGTGNEPSPFTAALLRHLAVPDRPITSALIDVGREVQEATKGRQTPWTQASLKRDVVLATTAARPVPAAAPADARAETTVGAAVDAPVPAAVAAPVAPVLVADGVPVSPTAPVTPRGEPPVIVPAQPPATRGFNAMVLLVMLGIAIGLGGWALYRFVFVDPPDPSVEPVTPEAKPETADCAGLGGAKEMACRVPDLDSADETTRLVTAKEVEHALGDVSLSSAEKAAIVAQLLEMTEAKRFATLSQDGRFNVLARLGSIPAELWLDPAMIAELERAHHAIATMAADESGLLGNQTSAFLKEWITRTGYRPRAEVTVYPHFAGFVREDFAKLMQALAMGWGWTLQELDREEGAAGKAQIRYGTDAMRPLALLMAAQLRGQVPPHSGDTAAIRGIIAKARLGRVDVAKVRMKDGQLEIWIGK